VALDVSRYVTDCHSPAEVRLVLDLLPDWTVEMLQHELGQPSGQHGARTVGRWLGLRVPQRLLEPLVATVEIDLATRLAELTKAVRLRLLQRLKSWVISVSGSRGFAKAEVTAGGVALGEVDPKTMASRRTPGLYLAGVVLDVDGPIGGYNFQAAFSTGYLAGERAAGAVDRHAS
jgi:predicted Rossmann fold flavoprotein